MAYNRIAGIGKLTMNSGTADNATVLQTMDNIICFCSRCRNVTVASGNAFAKLPSTISYPNAVIPFVAGYYENSTRKIGQFGVNINGNIISYQAISSGQIFLDGVCVNLNSTFYNDTIGNNDESTMTRPIMVN